MTMQQGAAPLFAGEPSPADGMRARRPGGAPPARWRIELTGVGQGGRASEVRVTLIDAETGKRIGAAMVPFEWVRDVAYNATCTAEISPGAWS